MMKMNNEKMNNEEVVTVIDMATVTKIPGTNSKLRDKLYNAIKVVFEEGVENIPSDFSKYYLTNKVREIVLPASLKKVGAGAFVGVPVYTLDFSKSAEIEIGECAFSNMENLNTVILPKEGISGLNSMAFLGDTNLREIEFGGYNGCYQIYIECFGQIPVQNVGYGKRLISYPSCLYWDEDKTLDGVFDLAWER